MRLTKGSVSVATTHALPVMLHRHKWVSVIGCRKSCFAGHGKHGKIVLTEQQECCSEAVIEHCVILLL